MIAAVIGLSASMVASAGLAPSAGGRAATRADATYSCPSYEEIRQPSVDPPEFSIDEIAGRWFLQATTEPTTRFCLCNMMTYEILEPTQYRYQDKCFQDLSPRKTWNNQTVTIGGYLSKNASSPGMLMEGFVIANHTLLPKPNMLFNVTRDARTGKLTTMRFYACLGKLLPFTKPVFSYLLNTRNIDVPEQQVRDMVEQDMRLAGGALQLDGMVYTNVSAWRTCGYSLS